MKQPKPATRARRMWAASGRCSHQFEVFPSEAMAKKFLLDALKPNETAVTFPVLVIPLTESALQEMREKVLQAMISTCQAADPDLGLHETEHTRAESEPFITAILAALGLTTDTKKQGRKKK